ncbi:MAG TPA: ABC transporter ATP-binding protein, partial [Actinophytocola sp.]|nr:ABC transporter ATP-binding protein [Actinophytocola sp.]
LGMLFRRELVMFGPREVLLTSDEPVVEQFLNGRRLGPIGMSEEKDEATMAAERAIHRTDEEDVRGIVPQLQPTPGMPERRAVRRRTDRVLRILHTLPPRARHAIRTSLDSLAGQGMAVR